MKYLTIGTFFHLIGDSSAATAEIILSQDGGHQLQKGEVAIADFPSTEEERKRLRPHKVNPAANITITASATAGKTDKVKSGKSSINTHSPTISPPTDGGKTPSPSSTPPASAKAGKQTKSDEKPKKSAKVAKSRRPPRPPPTKMPISDPGSQTPEPTLSPSLSTTLSPSLAPYNLTPSPTSPTESPTESATDPTKSPSPTYYDDDDSIPPPTSPQITEVPTSWTTYSPSAGPSPPELVLAPSCVADPDFSCLRTPDWGEEDTTKYKIDLSLEVVDPSTTDAYMTARAKWMEIIPGDLSPWYGRNDDPNDANDCNDPYPEVVDDLIICGRDMYIDGPSGILGQAGPQWARQDGTTGLLTTTAGIMMFDIPDIANMVAEGKWESVILHEMAHVIGIGTLWTFNNIVDANDPALEYKGEHAISVWQDDWGCAGTPPVETDYGPGTRGGHWDEECLDNELMTGFAENNGIAMPLSKLSIATLEDIGYTVNYAAAEEYDGGDTSCCIIADNGNLSLSKPSKPPLSQSGMNAAIKYGRKSLSDRTPSPQQLAHINNQKGVVYLGDRFITVLIEENGYIYDVFVTKE